jgi:hypothetical protein
VSRRSEDARVIAAGHATTSDGAQSWRGRTVIPATDATTSDGAQS